MREFVTPLRRWAPSDQCSQVEFTSDSAGSAADSAPDYGVEQRPERMVAISFAGPFDSFCKRLDAGLIERGWRAASEVLGTFDVDPGECRWGWVHPGRMVRALREVENPIDGFGWLLPRNEFRHVGLTSDVDATWREALRGIDERFRGCDPPLTVAISEPRSFEYVSADGNVLPPSSATIGMALLFRTALHDVSDWRAREDAGPGAWSDIARAMWRRDSALLYRALAEAVRSYTPAGVELVVRGFGDHLMQWQPDHVGGDEAHS